MMGLLDAFLKGTGDPEKDAAINQGLLNAGLALMQARGRLFPALGQAGQAGLQSFNQTQQQQQQQKRAALQDQMLKYQLGDQQRQQELAQLPNRFMLPGDGGIQPVDATGGMETALGNPNNIARSTDAKFDMQGYIQALMSKSPMQGLQLQQAMKKDTTPIKLGKGERLVTNDTFQPIGPAPMGDTTGDYANWQAELAAGRTKDDYTTWYRLNKKSGAQQQSISLTADRGYAGELAKNLAKQDTDAIDAAMSAPDRIRSARDVKRILSTEKPITGTAAEQRLWLTKALSTAGVIDGKTVTSTEDLASVLANQTLDAIKSSGLGGGQGFTDKDRQFLQDAKSGRLELNQGTLLRIADLNERAAVRAIERGKQIATRLKGNKDLGWVGQDLNFEVPEDARMPTADEIRAEAQRRAARGK